MKLSTPVTDLPCKAGISFEDKILMLGSCFSDSIGSRLADYGFDVLVNPFGTVYNPQSVLSSVRRLLDGKHFTEKDCVGMGAGADLVCSFSHNTSFARKTAEEFLCSANDALDRASAFFADCSKIVITLGTSWCFRHLERDVVVSNCLKRPAGEFARERMEVEEVSECLVSIMALCASAEARGAKHKDFIFTVSPIRHFADGAHGNQLSKATLLLGIDRAIAAVGEVWSPGNSCVLGTDSPKTEFPCRADYFPAYEIMMDELRGYRFYAEDMCHPSSQAEDYICSRFLDWALPSSERPALEANILRCRRSRHIPLR